MLSSNKSYKNGKVSLTIHCKYKYFDSTVQRAEDRGQKFYFCRLPFSVNGVKLNLSIQKERLRQYLRVARFKTFASRILAQIYILSNGFLTVHVDQKIFI